MEARHRFLRFGEFVADLHASRLRRGEQAVPVQKQPFLVLRALLTRCLDSPAPPKNREIVTRTELRGILWPERPEDEVSPSENHSINIAIAKVRELIGSDWLETVRSIGYRYMGPLPEPSGAQTAVPEPAEQTDAPASAVVPRRRRGNAFTLPLVIAGATLIVLWGVAAWWPTVEDGQPTSWELRGNSVWIHDEEGEELWSMPLGDVHLGSYEIPVRDQGKLVHIGDIDGNGRREVLVTRHPREFARRSGEMICLEHDGQERWRVQGGGIGRFRDRTFDSGFTPWFFGTIGDGQRRFIVVNSAHSPWFPTRILLVDPGSGETAGEYRHSGYFWDMAVLDVDGDGSPELLLAGVNNPGPGPGHPALAVLKLPDDSEPGPPGLLGAPEPLLVAYRLFANPDVYDMLGLKVTGMKIIPRPEGGLTVQIGLDSCYYVDLDGSLDSVGTRPCDTLAAQHAQFRRQGQLDHPLGDGSLENWDRVWKSDFTPDGNSAEVRRFFDD